MTLSQEVEKPGRSMRRLELHIDAQPPGLPTCHRIACALDASLVTVLWLAWVKSPIGLALQVAYLGSLFDQLSVEDQEALLEKQKEMVKAHRKAIESVGFAKTAFDVEAEWVDRVSRHRQSTEARSREFEAHFDDVVLDSNGDAG